MRNQYIYKEIDKVKQYIFMQSLIEKIYTYARMKVSEDQLYDWYFS